MTSQIIKRALISVSNKTGLSEFAKELIKHQVEIVSTGGTSKYLSAENIPHLQIEDLTGLPAILDGRVKTLHHKIHGGILGKRDAQAEEAATLGIKWIDLVVVNFYPFQAATTDSTLPFEKAIEFIDVGGPTMVRAAAKNCAWVSVVTDPSDYQNVSACLQNGLDIELRKSLAAKAFALTSQYDAAINLYFEKITAIENSPANNLQLSYDNKIELRYGENPHQQAAAYQLKNTHQGILSAQQLQGKPLSYNNILDAEAALQCCNEFTEPTCVIIKHANPCGVASASTIEEAFALALQTDPKSAFGGIVAVNATCTKDLAKLICDIFMEVIIAPNYMDEALTIFASKPNLRVLKITANERPKQEMRFINGGILIQDRDNFIPDIADLEIVTKTKINEGQLQEMLFAWKVLKHIKSNAILLSKNKTTLGIGAGQVSRIDSVEIALKKAGARALGCILASDAFFPFRDSIDFISNSKISAIIQPGGSVRDDEVIAACNEHAIAMVFTGKRCFKH